MPLASPPASYLCRILHGTACRKQRQAAGQKAWRRRDMPAYPTYRINLPLHSSCHPLWNNLGAFCPAPHLTYLPTSLVPPPPPTLSLSTFLLVGQVAGQREGGREAEEGREGGQPALPDYLPPPTACPPQSMHAPPHGVGDAPRLLSRRYWHACAYNTSLLLGRTAV